MRFCRVLVFILICVVQGNGQNVLRMDRKTELSILHIDVTFGKSVPLDYQEKVRRSMEASIEEFNKQKYSRYQAILDSVSETSKLTIQIDSVSFVTGKQRKNFLMIDAVTAIGLPIALISGGAELVALFWVYPTNKHISHVELSEDIRSKDYEVVPTFYYNTAGAFFRKHNANIDQSALRMGTFLYAQLTKINSKVKK